MFDDLETLFFQYTGNSDLRPNVSQVLPSGSLSGRDLSRLTFDFQWKMDDP